MIGGKPPNPHFNLLFLNESCIKIVVGDSAVLPYYDLQISVNIVYFQNLI